MPRKKKSELSKAIKKFHPNDYIGYRFVYDYRNDNLHCHLDCKNMDSNMVRLASNIDLNSIQDIVGELFNIKFIQHGFTSFSNIEKLIESFKHFNYEVKEWEGDFAFGRHTFLVIPITVENLEEKLIELSNYYKSTL